MKFKTFQTILCTTALLLASNSLLQADPITLSFESIEQRVPEGNVAFIYIELSEPSFLEVEVPYTISSMSTATAGVDGDDENQGDYVIQTDPDPDDDIKVGFESPIIIEPGETRVAIQVQTTQDDIVEGEEPETVIFDIDAAALNAANIVVGTDPLQHVLKIGDNDAVFVQFDSITQVTRESNPVRIPVSLSAPATQDVEVPFTVTFGTATGEDILLGADGSTQSPLIILAGGRTGFIQLQVNDDDVEDAANGGAFEEDFFVTLGTPKFVNTDTSLPGDDRQFRGIIQDDDPILVGFSSAFGRYDVFVDEHISPILELVLSSPSESDIIIPFTLSGTATLGTGDDNGDYFLEGFDNNEVTFTAGTTRGNFTISMNNDADIEENETIIVTLGQPRINTDAGGDVALDVGTEVFNLTIRDNDPLELQFGRNNPETPPTDDTEFDFYFPDNEADVEESDLTVNLPIFMDGAANAEISFDLEIVGASTTATIRDFTNNEQEDWDVGILVGQQQLLNPDEPISVSIFRGGQVQNVVLSLNNDAEPIVTPDNLSPEGVEPVETVTLRISNVQSDDPSVTLGANSQFTLNIHDLPDIDFSSFFSNLEPQVTGDLPVNSITGLFEVPFLHELTQALDPTLYPGYRSWKILYRPTRYDVNDPDNENNDSLIQNPQDPPLNSPYEFQVQYPVFPRYGAGTDVFVLREGEAQSDPEIFIDQNADIVELASYVLRRLNMPPLDEDEADRTEFFDINDPMDFLVEMTHGGNLNFPNARFDLSQDPNAIQIVLSRADLRDISGGLSLNPINVQPQPDGTILIEINTQSITGLEIQYWDDAESGWQSANPGRIAVPGSRLFWIDNGQPKTKTSSADVDFRLYRILQR